MIPRERAFALAARSTVGRKRCWPSELIEEIIDRLDSDGVAEDDELRTLVAMLRGAVFQMLNDAGATGD